MKVVLGNQNAGSVVEVELDSRHTEEEHVGLIKAGLDTLKLVSVTWKDWAVENETDDERELRELIEDKQVLERRALAKQNKQLRSMLDGD